MQPQKMAHEHSFSILQVSPVTRARTEARSLLPSSLLRSHECKGLGSQTRKDWKSRMRGGELAQSRHTGSRASSLAGNGKSPEPQIKRMAVGNHF